MGHDTPLVLQRQLRAAIRRFRHDAGLTQKQVATALEWSESKIMRIETGVTNVSATDLRALLAHYGVTDTDEVNGLATLARESRRRTWRDAYRQEIEPQFYLFLGYEESAVRIRQRHSSVVPVLLQTEEYARELARTFTDDNHRITRILELRADRQRVFDEHDEESTVEFLLDEAVLRRKVGNWPIMQDQLTRIREISQRQHVSIRVVPFEAGEHWGMASSFDIFDLSQDTDDRVVFVEQPARNAITDVTLRDGADEIALYVDGYHEAAKLANDPEDTTDLLDHLIAEYARRG